MSEKETEETEETDKTEKCSLCSSPDITDLGRYFTHYRGKDDYRSTATEPEPENFDKDTAEAHVMCDTCLKMFVRVCTCSKFFKSEPKTLTILCPCDKETFTKTYYDIDPNFLLPFLQNWNGDYYIIEGCRGCCYNIRDIEKNFKIALQGAIEACVYQKFEVKDPETGNITSIMKYQSDALDEDFIKQAEALGLGDKLGSAQDI